MRTMAYRFLLLLALVLVAPCGNAEPYIEVSAEKLVAFPAQYVGKRVATVIETNSKLHQDGQYLRPFDYNVMTLRPLLNTHLASQWLDTFEPYEGHFYVKVFGVIHKYGGGYTHIMTDHFDLSSESEFVRLREKR